MKSDEKGKDREADRTEDAPVPAGRRPYAPPQVTSRPLFERMAVVCDAFQKSNATPS